MKTKSRGNGQGCAYKRGSTWTAQVIVGWRTPKDPSQRPIPVKRTKGGFPTKRDALAACASLTKSRSRMTLKQVYDAWSASYASRVGESTMVCYASAFGHFATLHSTYIDLITANDLQDCMDSCPSGKRTHQNMKCVAGLLWAWAYDSDLVTRDVTKNLYIGKGETKQREPLTEDEVKIIRQAIPSEPYAAYIYALCYLGFRPGELLHLRKSDLHTEDDIIYLVGGSKTDAGRDRKVPVPQAILPIIQERLNVPGTDLLFPMAVFSRKGAFKGYKQMTDAYLRESVFKPLMARLGIAEGKVPYCARHTYSDKLKKADGDDKAKAALMGHTDYAFTRSHYQSTDLDDIKVIADSIT